ncbi:MAG TPA: hypothetical protein ENJ33_08000 [Thiothrix sp.]|nr:hypothetical protein [Thiothrix sp.]
MSQLSPYLLIALLSLLLTSCGGGGGGVSTGSDNNQYSTNQPSGLTTTGRDNNQSISTSQPPSLTTIGNKSVFSGETKIINLSATGESTLTFSATRSDGSALPSFISITTDGVLTLSPNTSASSQDYQLLIAVTDAANNTDNEIITVSIVANLAPTLSDIENQQSYLGAEDKQITLTAQDNENHSLTFSAKQTNGDALPDFITISTNAAKTAGTLIIKGDTAAVGNYATEITVTDEFGAQNSKTLMITITNGLTLNSVGNLQLIQGEQLTKTLSSVNLGTEAVSYTITLNDGNPAPDFIHINEDLLTVDENADTGEFNLTLTAIKNNTAGRITDSENIKITVKEIVMPKTVNILPLGDSITQARYDHLSYRYPLWKLLIDEGKDINFMGTQNQTYDGTRSWPSYNGLPFDQDHEGHSGKTADWILDNLNGYFSIYNENEEIADIVLIHLGTNDLLWTDDEPLTIKNDIGNVIDKLRTHNPMIKIVLAKITPFNYSGHILDNDNAFNATLDALANEKSQDDSPVIIVDMASGYDIDEYTFDGLHPNAVGETLIAQRWFDALINNDFL